MIDRWIRGLGRLSVVAVLVFGGRETIAAPPNVVFIMADDLGWADVAFHGGNAPTPNLDRLAAEGLELAQHYVAPVCSPTRAALMTGRFWSRMGVTTPTNERALPWETTTVATALRSVGYDTCLIGKWHLGSLPDEGPNRFGFDHAYGSLAGGVSPWNHRYKKGPFTHTWHRNGELVEETGHVTPLLTDEAIGWLESRGDAPFFLYVPYTAVHLPLKEPQEWLDRVPDSIEGEVAQHYAASVMHLDHSVGRILAALDRLGLRDNTLVVFTSDNGGSTAENNDLKYPDDNCPNGRLVGNNDPLRGEKGSLYEGGTRVTTLVSWPGHVKPGRVDAPVQIADWMPTLCGLAGFRPTDDLRWDGTDISGLLTEHRPPAERPLYAVGPGGRSRSLRLGDWKLVVTRTPADRPDKHELFHIAEDASEATDLSAAEPERVERLLEVLQQVAARDGDAAVTR